METRGMSLGGPSSGGLGQKGVCEGGLGVLGGPRSQWGIGKGQGRGVGDADPG